MGGNHTPLIPCEKKRNRKNYCGAQRDSNGDATVTVKRRINENNKEEPCELKKKKVTHED